MWLQGIARQALDRQARIHDMLALLQHAPPTSVTSAEAGTAKGPPITISLLHET